MWHFYFSLQKHSFYMADITILASVVLQHLMLQTLWFIPENNQAGLAVVAFYFFWEPKYYAVDPGKGQANNVSFVRQL